VTIAQTHKISTSAAWDFSAQPKIESDSFAAAQSADRTDTPQPTPRHEHTPIFLVLVCYVNFEIAKKATLFTILSR